MLRNKMTTFAAQIVLGGMISSSASAAVILVQDDFESYSLTPTNQNIGAPWGGSNYQANQNVRVVAEQSPFDGVTAGQALQYFDSSTTGSPFTRRTLPSVGTNETLDIQFDFISHGPAVSGGSASALAAIFQVMYDNGTSAQQAGLIFRLDSNGKLSYSNTSGAEIVLEDLVRDEWYRASLTLLPASNASDKWSLTLQRFGQEPVIYGEGGTLAFRNNIPAFSSIQFSSNTPASAARFAVDNVLVSIPEPQVAVCIAGYGLLALTRRRRPVV